MIVDLFRLKTFWGNFMYLVNCEPRVQIAFTATEL